MSRSSNSTGSNLVFFLCGAAVGAAVALLYAPREGEATRRLIGEKAGDAREKATEVTETVSHTAREKWDVVAEKARTLLHRDGQDIPASEVTVSPVADSTEI